MRPVILSCKHTGTNIEILIYLKLVKIERIDNDSRCSSEHTSRYVRRITLHS